MWGITLKKIFILFFTVVCVVVFVPAIIIFVFDFGNLPSGTENEIRITALLDGEVLEFGIEEYLEGVLAAEMPASFHEEALKAQAVAARTYIIRKKEHTDNDHPEAFVCGDSTHCKAYLANEQISEKFGEGWHKEYGEKIKNAIKSTKGEIAVYGGEPIEAVFHSASGGITENAVDVWGGDVPYLVNVESPGDELAPVYLNDVPVKSDDFKAKIGEDIAPYVGEIIRNTSGSVKTVDFGGRIFEGVEVRRMFSLPSTNFSITANGDEFVFHCKGKGHGVGMSQYGAEYFAKQGMGYKEILKTYYKGIEIIKTEEQND